MQIRGGHLALKEASKGLLEILAGLGLDLVGILLSEIDTQEFYGRVPRRKSDMAPVDRLDIGLTRRKCLFPSTPVIDAKFS